jgi:hypothetical protein
VIAHWLHTPNRRKRNHQSEAPPEDDKTKEPEAKQGIT